MNIIEEEFKNRYKDQKSMQDIDADDLWLSVVENLEGTSPKSNKAFRNISIGLSILILLLWGFCSQYNAKKENLAKIENKLSPSNDSYISPTVAPKLNANLSDEKEQNIEVASAHSADNKSLQNRVGIAPKNNFNDVDDRKKLLNKKDFFTNLPPLNPTVESKSTPNLPIEPTVLNDLNSSETIRSDSKNEILHTITAKYLDRLPSLPILPLTTLSADPELPKIQLIQDFPKPKPASFNSFQIAALSGLNTVFTHFQDKNNNPELWNELTEAHTNEVGYSASLRLSWLIKEKYSVGTGVDFDHIRSKFQTIKDLDTTVWQDGYLTHFDMDPISGDTINQVYETVLLRANKKRSVLHHNRFQLISIPLEIGFQQQKGKFGFGLNLGIRSDFFIGQKGKIFNSNGEIQNFNNNRSGDLPFKKFSISYHLNPFVDYKISKNIKFRLSPVVRYQPPGVSDLYGLSHYSLFTSLNGGFVFKL